MNDQPPVPHPPKHLSDADRRALIAAHDKLEHPHLAAQIANLFGAPIESLITKRLPHAITSRIDGISRRALGIALRSALSTMTSRNDARPAHPRLHRLAVAATGGAGGFFGLPGLAVELPVTTTLMLRSIADIARAEGEPLEDPQTAMACLEVIAHGGHSRRDDGAESGYFAVRAAMAQQLNAAAQFITAHGIAGKGAPALVAAVARIAARFSVTVSEKIAAQAVPVVGAVSGAALNTLFIGHFQAVAQGHFTVRRLERHYGAATVRAAYETLTREGSRT